MVFVPNPLFEKEILRADFVRDKLEDLVEAGADHYREGLPVDTGDLKASVFGQVALTEDGYVGRIGATDWKAALVEFGAGPNPPDGSLRRAVEALGLDVTPRGED